MKIVRPFLFLLPPALFLMAAPAMPARSMLDLPGFPVAGLHVYMPAETYQRFVNEPVKAWIQLRGQIVNSQVSGARVIRSEGRGVYDKACTQIANGMQISTDVTSTRIPPSVVVHVLIYQLPKGEHAFAFAQDDTLGRSNFIYSRSIRVCYLGLANQQARAKKK